MTTAGGVAAVVVVVAVFCLLQCGAAIAGDTPPTTPRAADFVPLDEDGLLAKIVSPHSVEEFMNKYYEHATLRIARDDPDHFAWLRAGSFDRLNDVVDAFQRDGSLASGIKVSLQRVTGHLTSDTARLCLLSSLVLPLLACPCLIVYLSGHALCMTFLLVNATRRQNCPLTLA
jgi:hypothetical protein